MNIDINLILDLIKELNELKVVSVGDNELVFRSNLDHILDEYIDKLQKLSR